MSGKSIQLSQLESAVLRALTTPNGSSFLFSELKSLLHRPDLDDVVFNACFEKIARLTQTVDTSCGCTWLSIYPNWTIAVTSFTEDKATIALAYLARIANRWPECFILHFDAFIDVIVKTLRSTKQERLRLGIELATSILCHLFSLHILESQEVCEDIKNECKHVFSPQEISDAKHKLKERIAPSAFVDNICRSLRNQLKQTESNVLFQRSLFRFTTVLFYKPVFAALIPDLMDIMEKEDLGEILIEFCRIAIENRCFVLLERANATIMAYLIADRDRMLTYLDAWTQAAKIRFMRASQIKTSVVDLLCFLNSCIHLFVSKRHKVVEMSDVTLKLIDQVVSVTKEIREDNDSPLLYMATQVTSKLFQVLLLSQGFPQKGQFHSAIIELQFCFHTSGLLPLTLQTAEQLIEEIVQDPFFRQQISSDELNTSSQSLAFMNCGIDVLYFLSLCIHGNSEIAQKYEEVASLEWTTECLRAIHKGFPGPFSFDSQLVLARFIGELIHLVEEILFHKCQRPHLTPDAFIRMGTVLKLLEVLTQLANVQYLVPPIHLPLIHRCLTVMNFLKHWALVGLDDGLAEIRDRVLKLIAQNVGSLDAIIKKVKFKICNHFNQADGCLMTDLEQAEGLIQFL